MDIGDRKGSTNEESYEVQEVGTSCSDCQAYVIGDRFCQECGARVTNSRSRKSAGRQTAGKQPVREPKDAGPAPIICINCGTTNSQLDSKCSDCQIPLIPASPAGSPASIVKQTGLRGSLTNRNTGAGTMSPAPMKPGSPAVQKADGTRRSTAYADDSSKVTSDSSATRSKMDGKRSNQNTVDKGSDDAAGRVRTNTAAFAERLNGDRQALEFLFPNEDRQRSSALASFDRLISETRYASQGFSLSAAIVRVESYLEQIPTPLVLCVAGLIIVIATVNATNYWTHYEQRMAALNKIAANAEEDMRAFRLDDAIRTLRSLEQTEHGDLPPRARSVLNQSLWLRSYSWAKQHNYGKAVRDLSRVTQDFASYEDAREKLISYRKLLASHPEFDTTAGSDHAPGQANATGSGNLRTMATRGQKTKPTPPSHKSDRQAIALKNESGISQNDGDSLAALSRFERSQKKQLREKARTNEDSRTSHEEPVSLAQTKQAKEKRKSQGDLLDQDMKRYSNLLVEYFSKAELTRASGERVEEPPSYEEWAQSGKREF